MWGLFGREPLLIFKPSLPVDVVTDIGIPTRVTIEVLSVENWHNIRPLWRSLEERSPYVSFFLSAEWVDTWIDVFAPIVPTSILICRCNGELIGASLLTSARTRRGPVPLRRSHLHTAGEPIEDGVCVEFNNLLCCDGFEHLCSAAIAQHLKMQVWDELELPGFADGTCLEALRREFSTYECDVNASVSYYVDLSGLRDSGSTYVDSLRQPTRKHVRQYLRAYARLGELKTEEARTKAEALEFLQELSALHQFSWQQRDMPGAFSSARFLEFHQKLIAANFPLGRILLVRIRAGARTIGVLYAFIYSGKVYFYQSGFDYSLDRKLSPGIVANVCAIEHCLQKDLKEYDFLAGDVQYKRSLSSHSRKLYWITFRRGNVRTRAVSALRSLKVQFKKIFQKRDSDEPEPQQDL